ncbi:MYST (SAS MOZ) family [Rhizoctonia solani]|uniref:Histone acetyltransferase n=1 Tax=Rhizoctonia solani TaxID=456999 RepID=A0A8H7IDM6_9AGAM|nr:MYST (SAS MOZ) family [Rhizoctonia solani]
MMDGRCIAHTIRGGKDREREKVGFPAPRFRGCWGHTKDGPLVSLAGSMRFPQVWPNTLGLGTGYFFLLSCREDVAPRSLVQDRRSRRVLVPLVISVKGWIWIVLILSIQCLSINVFPSFVASWGLDQTRPPSITLSRSLSLSTELRTNKEGRTGTPERPLSALGALSYKNYWKLTIMLFLHKAQGRIRIRDISAATCITAEDVFETLRENKLITGPGISTNSVANALPRKRGPGRPPRKPVEKKDDGHGHEPSAPVSYVQNWERKGHLRLKPDRLKWVPYRLSRHPTTADQQQEREHEHEQEPDAAERSESDDEPVSDASEDLGGPVQPLAPAAPAAPPPVLIVNTLIPRKTRSRVPTSHPSDDEVDEDEDAAPHSMTRRSGSRHIIGQQPWNRSARLSRWRTIDPSHAHTLYALLKGEQTTPIRPTTPPRRETRARSLRQDKEDREQLMSDEDLPAIVSSRNKKNSRRSSPVRKRRRIESSPESTPAPTSPGRNGLRNGRSPLANGPSYVQRAERERSVSLGSGMVYDDVPPAVLNGNNPLVVVSAPPPQAPPSALSAPLPTGQLGNPTCPFTSDDGSPLTSVKEELTDIASEGPALMGEFYDDDALGDEDAEGNLTKMQREKWMNHFYENHSYAG